MCRKTQKPKCKECFYVFLKMNRLGVIQVVIFVVFLEWLSIKNLKIWQSLTKSNSAATREAQSLSSQQITSCRGRCRTQISHFTGYSEGLAQKNCGAISSGFVHVEEVQKTDCRFYLRVILHAPCHRLGLTRPLDK